MTVRTCAWTGEETDEKFYVLATDGEPTELVSESALRVLPADAVARLEWCETQIRRLMAHVNELDNAGGDAAPAKTSTAKATAEKAK